MKNEIPNNTKEDFPEFESEPIFEGELELPGDLRITLRHKNYGEIEEIAIISSEGKKIDLKKYLPLPEGMVFGIGNDFYVEKRGHLPEKVNIPDIESYIGSYKKSGNIPIPYEYSLLLFHEFGHVNGDGMEAKIKLDEFYARFPGARNAFHLPKEFQNQALVLESEAEIEAFIWSVNQIKKIEQENNITILTIGKTEIEDLINLLLDEFRKKYKELLIETDNEFFKFKLDS